MDDIHLIGHSLGSHIAGYAGQNLSAAIGRISGLDPAEPYFEGKLYHLFNVTLHKCGQSIE